MAASGGYWTKGAGADVAGYVFIEKMVLGATGMTIKAGYAGVTVGGQHYKVSESVPITGTQQGGLVAHKALNSAGWNVSHAPSGLAIAGGFKSEAQAKAMMEKLNQTGVQWKKSVDKGITAEMQAKGLTSSDMSKIKAQIAGKTPTEAKAGIASKEGVKGLEAKKAGKAMTPAEAKAAAKADADSIKKTGLNVADAAAAVKNVKAQNALAKKLMLSSEKWAAKEAQTAAKSQNAAEKKVLAQHAKAMAESSQEAKAAGLKHMTPEGYSKTEVVNGVPIHLNKATGKWDVVDANGDAIGTSWKKGATGKADAVANAKYKLANGSNTNKEHIAKVQAETDAFNKKYEADKVVAQAKLDATNAAKTVVTPNAKVTLTTKTGKTIETEGTKVGADHSVTLNKNTDKWHVNDATGKTISTHATEADALSAAKDAALTGKTATPAYKPGQYKIGEAPAGMHIPEGYAAYHSSAHALQELGAAYNAQGNKFTSAEKNAAELWVDSAYSSLNLALWHGKAMSSESTKVMTGLDSAFAKSALPHNTVLVRSDYIGGHHVSNLLKTMKVGDAYTAKGYDAAAADTTWHAGSPRMVFHAPAGTKAIYMGQKQLGMAGESEVLLARGLQWKLTKINGKDYHFEPVIGENAG